MSKQCPKCTKVKPLTEFNKNKARADGLQSVCRACQKTVDRSYYRDNTATVRKRNNDYRAQVIEEGRAYLRKYLQTHPCVDCSCTNIRVLDFDHVRGTKTDAVTRLLNIGCSLETLKQEVAKCDVRCRNCHAIKTYERMGGSWRD